MKEKKEPRSHKPDHTCHLCDRSDLSKIPQIGIGNNKCRQDKCITCIYLSPGKLYESFVHKRELVIHFTLGLDLNCQNGC